MTKLNPNLRHHSARPLSTVKPNTLVNDKPNQSPEKASLPAPNPNPSLDAMNSRLNTINLEEPDDACDPDDPDCDEDRLSAKHLS